MSEMRAESVSMVEVQLLRGHVAEAAGASVRLLKTLGQEAGSELQSELLLRLLYVALQALFLVERQSEVEELLDASLGGAHNIPCSAFLLWQLLLNGCGRAPEAKLHLERRLARLAEQPLVEPATGSAQRLELVALCRCFALDTLCDGMGDYDGAAAWLNQQQQRRGTTVADPPSGASGAVVVGPLPLEQAQQLLLEVQERRKSRADQQAPGGGAPAAALPSGKQQRPPNPGARPSPSDFCTMTGGLSGEEEEGQAEGPLHSDATSSGEPSALKAPGTAAAAAIERRHALPPPPPASSARLVLSRWWIAACRKLRCLLLQCAARLNSIGGLEGATGSWPSTLYALASCALLFALVAEGRTLGAAAKLWWRQLRAALRSVMGELLAMGLSITPNPLTNGYTHRSSS